MPGSGGDSDGQASQALQRALEKLTVELRGAARVQEAVSRSAASGGASGGLGIAGAAASQTAGFAVNAAAQATTRAARESAFAFIDNRLRFGDVETPAQSAQQAALQGVGTLPIFGKGIAREFKPDQEAEQRAKGIVTDIARIGGKVSDDIIDRLLGDFNE